MSLLITNVEIFVNDEQNRVIRNGAVAIQGNRIVAVGSELQLREAYADLPVLDGGGRLLMPGWVNVHMHFYSTFARGLALPETPRNFAEILKFLWWRLDRSLDPEAVYFSALLPAIGAAKAGVTAFIDHHASPHAVDGSLDRIEAALAQVGLRGILCYEVSDRDGRAIAQQGLRENERYIRECQRARQHDPSHPFDGMVGLHASFTVDDNTLEAAVDLSRTLNRGCHIHVLEDAVDREETFRKYGQQSVIERLVRSGVLTSGAIAAHCIHLNEKEKDLLAESGAFIAHQPQSNMNNAVGRTDILGLLNRGVIAGIGTDGMTPDVKADVRMAAWLHKHALQDPNFGWEEIQTMAWKNNPRIYREISGQPVGQVKEGFLADLILLDYWAPTELTPDNIWGHFLFGFIDAPVNTTIVNGRVIMRDRQLLHIDEEKIAYEARVVARRVWERFYQTR
ncbi:MAG: putative aminohydrolase SsnA [Calditrichaeota bacterium]|nr:putative aminohydrolase SsnA [Calditrichota bacterium]